MKNGRKRAVIGGRSGFAASIGEPSGSWSASRRGPWSTAMHPYG